MMIYDLGFLLCQLQVHKIPAGGTQNKKKKYIPPCLVGKLNCKVLRTNKIQKIKDINTFCHQFFNPVKKEKIQKMQKTNTSNPPYFSTALYTNKEEYLTDKKFAAIFKH
jgi:hypothetical protein